MGSEGAERTGDVAGVTRDHSGFHVETRLVRRVQVLHRRRAFCLYSGIIKGGSHSNEYDTNTVISNYDSIDTV